VFDSNVPHSQPEGELANHANIASMRYAGNHVPGHQDAHHATAVTQAGTSANIWS